ncbi:PREDICTED: altered inheritance rate of mitochondria protein 25 [Tarenaya hassleriana]|uniref:altered inheritance rate of mitochondria protein 25 n=1 Tax=Tarenaya hassleriana TaxID=28532 RepID=UPI00053C436B|nr:PREDICTED: altered inheritance rate of mitochondria protein 25 [Tarenaya hassleriana]
MHYLSRRSSVSALLRSGCWRRRDAASAISGSAAPLDDACDITLDRVGEGIGCALAGRNELRGSEIRTGSRCREGLGIRMMHSRANNAIVWRYTLPFLSHGSPSGRERVSYPISRCFSHGSESDDRLDRNFLAQLWVTEKKTRKDREKRRVSKNRSYPGNASKGKLFSNVATEENQYDQPPVSQSMSGFLAPTTSEEIRVAPLLARSNLLITRDIEWANLVLGFEQENRYAVVDVCYPRAPVGFIREQSNIIARQLLRLRRPFVASITDALGNELFRVRRPFWWINSSIYAEIDGKEIGVVHRRWHLWRRIYDLYLGNKQFAVVENPGLWNWTFTLKDVDGEVLAQIDRDWRGFGFEIFTDAGQYVIRFGEADAATPKTGAARTVEELEVKRPLTLSERAVAVALAISLDNDYFSRHGGWGLPFVAVGE